MRIRHLFFIAAAVTFAACSKPEEPIVEPEDSISVQPTVLNFDGKAGSADVTVTATGSWSASGVPSWMTLSPASGTGNAKVSVAVQAGADKARSAEITFKCGSKSQALTVNQEAAPVTPPTPTPTITGNVTSVELEADQTEATFKITVSDLKGKWTVTPKATYDWVSDYTKEGTASGDIVVKVAANTSETARSAEFTVASEGATSVTLTLAQKGAQLPSLSVAPEKLEIDATATEGKFTVTVKNLKGKWTVTPKETYSWVTSYTKEGTTSGDIVVKVTTNAVAEARSAIFSVTSEGVSGVAINLTQKAGTPPDPGTGIKTAEEFLEWYKNPITDATLAADIDLTGKEYEPAYLQMAKLDGKGHKITYSLKYEGKVKTSDDPSIVDWGLFRGVRKGTISNLKVAGTIVFSPEEGTGTYHIGGLAGNVFEGSVIENCESSVKILGTTKVTHHMGGIIGFMEESTVKNCVNKGKVEMIIPEKGAANASQLGGIVGHIEGKGLVESCTNDGQVTYEGTGTPRIAGTCGYINNLVDVTFKNCTNNGLIQLNEGTYTSTSWSYVGGITGYYGTPTIGGKVLYDGCVNNGKVELNITEAKTKMRAGGIAAHGGRTSTDDAAMTWTLKNCTNNGDVISTSATANNYLGGIFGYAEVSCEIICDGCTNNAKVSTAGEGFVGGILGRNCSVESKFTNFKVTDKSFLEAKNNKGKAGLIMGWNSAIKTAMTGKVAGSVAMGPSSTTITEANYKDYLLYNELGDGGSVTGVTYGK